MVILLLSISILPVYSFSPFRVSGKIKHIKVYREGACTVELDAESIKYWDGDIVWANNGDPSPIEYESDKFHTSIFVIENKENKNTILASLFYAKMMDFQVRLTLDCFESDGKWENNLVYFVQVPFIE